MKKETEDCQFLHEILDFYFSKVIFATLNTVTIVAV